LPIGEQIFEQRIFLGGEFYFLSSSFNLLRKAVQFQFTDAENAGTTDWDTAQFERDAAHEFAKAERKLSYPTISAVASGDVIPIRDSRLPENYGAR
jgi:hypothetical protein